MIYSRWRPDQGGYDYFESAERRGLGNDMPIPRLLGGTRLGVPSTEIGRKPPGSVRYVGRGPLARGAIMPMEKLGLSGALGLVAQVPSWVLLAVGVTVGWVLGRGSKRT